MFKKLPIYCLALCMFFLACNKDPQDGEEPGTSSSNEPTTLDNALLDILREAADGQGLDHFVLPQSNDFSKIPQDPNNPLTGAKVKLGKLLYHETALAIHPTKEMSKGTYSCASCHHAGAGFQAGVAQAIGDGGIGFGVAGEDRAKNNFYTSGEVDVQPIRTPSMMNAAYQINQLWNGQFGATGLNAGTESQWTPDTPKEVNTLGYEGVETQAIAGLKVHRMGIDMNLINTTQYRSLFDQAFPDFSEADRYNNITAGLAIAAYERTVLSNQAPFQEWLKGNYKAMTDTEKIGAALFFKDGGCVDCHTGPALNSMEFYALCMDDLVGPGVYGEGDPMAKFGRGGFTGNPADNYKFKVPQLYNLKDAGIFGHGGTFNSLREVVEYKNMAQPANNEVPLTQIPNEFQPLNLTPTEIESLVSFLEGGLHDPNLERYVPESIPSGQCFPNSDPLSKSDLGCN